MAVDKLLILQNIQTTLASITVANGYRTTIDTVEPTIKVWGEVDDAHAMPWLGFGPTETRPFELLPGGQLRPLMAISVVAHIHEVDASTARTTICNLEDDIMHAMCSSDVDSVTGVPFSQQGDEGTPALPNAIHTTWIRTVDNAPDPTISSDGGLCMVMEFEIVWDRTTSRSPT